MICNEKLGIEKIHHVAVAVGDMDKALELWRDKLGFKPIVQEFPDLKMVESAFYIGEVQMQLYASTEPNERFSNWVKENGGDGPHHVCYCVADLNKTMEAVKEAGMECVAYGAGSQGTHFMIDKKYTNGCEIEFLELHDFLKGKTVAEQQKIVAEKYGRGKCPDSMDNDLLGIEKIHHIAVAVADMDKALSIWRDALGFDPIVQPFPELKMVESAFYIGEVQMQLYASTEPNERFSNWCAEKGYDGPHHVCYCVSDLKKTMAAVEAAGMECVAYGAGSQGTHFMINKDQTYGCEIEFLELHDFLKGKTVEEQQAIVREKFAK